MILDRPPKEWKRPATSTKTKLQVLLNQDGRCKVSGERLGKVDNTHFDHRPALWERKFDTSAWDTIPPANDPDHIEAITIEAHDRRTHGPGGTRRITTAGSDSHRRAKEKRLTEPRSDKPKRKIRSAGFQKGRGFPKRQGAIR